MQVARGLDKAGSGMKPQMPEPKKLSDTSSGCAKLAEMRHQPLSLQAKACEVLPNEFDYV